MPYFGSSPATTALTSANIADSAITTAKINADAVTSAKIAAGVVVASDIATDTITADKIAAGAVGTSELAADSVTAAKIGDDVIDSEHYVAASIDNAHLADDAVDSDELAAGAVDLAHLSASGSASSSTFLRGDNSWQAAGGGKILQVVQSLKTDTFTHTGDAVFTDVTGMSKAITISAGSDVLVICSMSISMTAGSFWQGQLLRGSTPIFIGDAAGSRTRCTFGSVGVANTNDFATFVGLDIAPGAATYTYKAQIRLNASGNTLYLNSPPSTSDAAAYGRFASTFILMEIA